MFKSRQSIFLKMRIFLIIPGSIPPGIGTKDRPQIHNPLVINLVYIQSLASHLFPRHLQATHPIPGTPRTPRTHTQPIGRPTPTDRPAPLQPPRNPPTRPIRLAHFLVIVLGFLGVDFHVDVAILLTDEDESAFALCEFATELVLADFEMLLAHP